MANRDYFTRPIQGNGRDHHGYGNTRLHHERAPRDPWTKPVLIFAGLIAAYFIWQFWGR
jgi:hypothetical protein